MSQYYYLKLPLQLQVLYKKMRDAIIRHNEYFFCKENEFPESTYYEILKAIFLENPNIYFIRPDLLTFEATPWGIIKIRPQYVYEKRQREIWDKKILDKSNKILQVVNKFANDEEDKIKILHDIFVSQIKLHSEYDEIEVSDITLVGALLNENSLSDGIALAYKFLLQQMGIDSVVICGFIQKNKNYNEPRVWNMVNINGQEYHIDIAEDIIRSNNDNICHDYFKLTVEMISLDHIWSGRKKYLDTESIVATLDDSDEDMLFTILLDMDEYNDSLEQKTIEGFTNCFKLLSDCGLQEEITKQLGAIVNRMNILSDAINKFEKIYNADVSMFIDNYIPETLNIIIGYIEYVKAEVDKKILISTQIEIAEALDTLLIGINDKINEIYKFASIELKAAAKALNATMNLDGYIDSKFKIK